jgi:hypothetical protein
MLRVLDMPLQRSAPAAYSVLMLLLQLLNMRPASSSAFAAPPLHTSCKQPLVGGMNVSFWTSATFSAGDSPQVVLGMGTGPAGHVPQTLLLSIGVGGKCIWQQTSAALTDPRTSGCAVPISPNRVMFAGGHNNSAQVRMDIVAPSFNPPVRCSLDDAHRGFYLPWQYVGTIDIFLKDPASGIVSREPGNLSLPVGRELVGCASIGGLVLFAGGKPPHPPAPMGEVRCNTLTLPRVLLLHDLCSS